MSTNEIIAEQPRLSPDELVLIKNKVDEVLKDRGSLELDSFFVSCLQAAKSAPDIPADFSENIDAYLYGGKPVPHG
ncbi:MAG: hypothetical protein Q7S40_01275 [Opitutaceae bacterium]|nr:hypothetical protein [Opitutaceae bacterium]